MTPFLTCPRSTRARQNYFSRRTRSKPQLPPSSGRPQLHWGSTPSCPGLLGKGAPRSQGRALHHPLARPSPAAGNSLASLAHRPGITAARGPHARLCAAHPGLRDAANRSPSPPPGTGVRPPTCRPSRPVGSFPRAPGPRDPGTGMIKKGSEERDQGRIRFPLPRRAGEACPLLQAELPPLASPSAGRVPPPRGPDLGTWAGLSAQPPALGPSPAFQPGSKSRTPKKFRDPNPELGKLPSLSREGRARGDSTCLPPASGSEKEILRISTPTCPPP